MTARPALRPPSRWAGWAAGLALMMLAGCATAPQPTGPADVMTGPWSGRLALRVQDKPAESFSAGFELKGNAQAGELSLYSPLGGMMALLDWQPGSATLRTGGEPRQFASVDSLVAQVVGEPIPVAALFDWLRGLDTHVPGWRADLSQLAQGRLSAKRLQPPPEADLRLVLER
jgi:outer membrane lipoprotein LolB